ncbi:MAG: ribonuclease Y [Candidatus Omnitrophica bacterium]|nr:ribonuclease Y [Candidatus Omnitrophota bacterium]MCM8803098.1 ribonuclease Y [Candidatus Omnitrophota bacterium]
MINSINTLKLIIPWFILWGAISILVGYLWRKYVSERTIKSAEKRAKEIIQEAEDIALKKKREIDIEAKELIYKLRSDFEKETKNKRKELQFQEKRLQQKELAIERKAEIIEIREEELSKKEKEIQRKEEEIKNKEMEYTKLIEEEKRKLELISGISREEAKNQLLKIMEEEARKEAIKLQQKIENEVRENAEKKAREILLTTMQRLAPEEATESVISVVSLPSDEIKGRIIGREGRNIKVFEALTGVDLIVDDTPEAVTISCFNLYRRELARQALEKLIADGRIHPARIEEIVEKTKKQLEEQLVEDGNRVLFEIGIENVHPELVKLLGKLKYRTSFGQNLLIHSKECAFMAGIIASELGYNPKIAKRAALFHDIGKAMDQEVEGAHPEIGGEILKKYGESDEVVNAALHHHNDISINTPYTLITQIADALSATRTGARRDTLEKYLRRIEELEKIASSFKGVDSAYAISAGREVRVIVKPEEITDDDARVLVKEIAKKIEENMEYIGQVKVTVIREKREVEFAK